MYCLQLSSWKNVLCFAALALISAVDDIPFSRPHVSSIGIADVAVVLSHDALELKCDRDSKWGTFSCYSCAHRSIHSIDCVKSHVFEDLWALKGSFTSSLYCFFTTSYWLSTCVSHFKIDAFSKFSSGFSNFSLWSFPEILLASFFSQSLSESVSLVGKLYFLVRCSRALYFSKMQIFSVQWLVKPSRSSYEVFTMNYRHGVRRSQLVHSHSPYMSRTSITPHCPGNHRWKRISKKVFFLSNNLLNLP